MGLSVTEYLLAKGDIVIAAVRRPESMQEHQANYGADKLLVVKVDVQKQEDIDAAFSKAQTTFGRIDVVYNNAGYSAVGEVEAMPLEDGKDMFEVGYQFPSHACALSDSVFRLTSLARPEYPSLPSSFSVR
jgi:NAD(P)-dependent dehydrogenase (short-subunit alcohol dehydrogenase family)